MRVVSGTAQEEHNLFGAKMELTATKIVEMFCESVPGACLQMYTLLWYGGGDNMTQKVTSIVISAFTIGMGSAAISYDFDADPEQRKKNPAFYGKLSTSFGVGGVRTNITTPPRLSPG